MDYITEKFEVDYYKGWLVITDKSAMKNECVQLMNSKGRNITLNQFKNCIKTHGIDRACKTFLKLAATYKPQVIQSYS